MTRLHEQDPTTAAAVAPEHVAWMWQGLALAACQAAAVGGEERFREVIRHGRRLLQELIFVRPGASGGAAAS